MRLTRKTFFGDYALEEDNEKAKNTAFNKLGQLEDIEERLDIDLITLFKALRNGIYEKISFDEENKNPELRFWDREELSLGYQFYSNEYEAVENDWTIHEGYELGLIVRGELFYLHRYGQTWALTREELL